MTQAAPVHSIQEHGSVMEILWVTGLTLNRREELREQPTKACEHGKCQSPLRAGLDSYIFVQSSNSLKAMTSGFSPLHKHLWKHYLHEHNLCKPTGMWLVILKVTASFFLLRHPLQRGVYNPESPENALALNTVQTPLRLRSKFTNQGSSVGLRPNFSCLHPSKPAVLRGEQQARRYLSPAVKYQAMKEAHMGLPLV